MGENMWKLNEEEQALLLDMINEGIGERTASTNSDRRKEAFKAMDIRRKLIVQGILPPTPDVQRTGRD